STYEGEPLDTTEVFDPATRTFRPGPTLSAPRRGHGAALVDDEVLILGGAASLGQDGLGYQASMELVGLNSERGELLQASLGFAQSEHLVAELGARRVLVLGGQGLGGPVYGEVIEVAQDGSAAVSERTDSPRLKGAALVADTGNVVILGGRLADETTSSTGWVHFDGQTFTEVPGAGLTRRQGARAVYSPRANLTLLAGGTEDGERVSTCVEALLLGAGAVELESLRFARREHSFTLSQDETLAFAIGGYDAAGRPLSSVEHVIVPSVEELYGTFPSAAPGPASVDLEIELLPSELATMLRAATGADCRPDKVVSDLLAKIKDKNAQVQALLAKGKKHEAQKVAKQEAAYLDQLRQVRSTLGASSAVSFKVDAAEVAALLLRVADTSDASQTQVKAMPLQADSAVSIAKLEAALSAMGVANAKDVAEKTRGHLSLCAASAGSQQAATILQGRHRLYSGLDATAASTRLPLTTQAELNAALVSQVAGQTSAAQTVDQARVLLGAPTQATPRAEDAYLLLGAALSNAP
ncbi:MAG TPA: hypothetical protein DEA08_13290, partial [Planctomycetes bacterium]|nr:hypothetical protein [Planctomycetota bacterium]